MIYISQHALEAVFGNLGRFVAEHWENWWFVLLIAGAVLGGIFFGGGNNLRPTR